MSSLKTEKGEQIYLQKNLSMLKGHAVPLFGYHILREQIIAQITGEYQSSILYWAGKNLAEQLPVSSYEECSDLFLELGWGQLRLDQVKGGGKIFHLESPFFSARQMNTNPSTFALECGFLTEVVARLEQQTTQGEFSCTHKQNHLAVQFVIRSQDKK